MKLGAGVDPRQDGKSRGCEGIEEERKSRHQRQNLMDPRLRKRPKWHKNTKNTGAALHGDCFVAN